MAVPSDPEARPAAGASCARVSGLLALVLLLWTTAAAAFPRDPEDTLDDVLAAGRVTVAVADNPPWVVVSQEGAPRGAEIALVTAFAGDLGVEVSWLRLSAFEALAAVEQGKADLAVGGFLRKDLTASGIAAPSLAYFREDIVVVDRGGKAVPADLDGLPVLVPGDLVAEGAVREAGGVPVRDPETPLVALPLWQAEAEGVRLTGPVLETRHHVFAVRKGENAWLFRLETFLRSRARDVPALLRAAP